MRSGVSAPSSAFVDRDPETIDATTELHLIEEHTNDDGSVTVDIVGWSREGETVTVEFALPTGDREAVTYPWPTPGRYDDNEFVELVRSLGYSPGAAEHIAGERISARPIERSSEGSTDGAGRPRSDDGAGRSDTAVDRWELSADGFEPDWTPAPMLPTAAAIPPATVASIETGPIDLALGGIFALFLATLLPGIAAIGAGSSSGMLTVLSIASLLSLVGGLVLIVAATLLVFDR